MAHVLSEVLDEIRATGFSVVHFDNYDACEAFLNSIGPTVVKTRIEVIEDERALLNSRDSMPFHTDHPSIGLIAWYCVHQSDEGGESLLIDFDDVMKSLAADCLKALHDVNVGVPPLKRGDQRSVQALISDDGVYYADWLLPTPANVEMAQAIRTLKEKIGEQPAKSIRLQAGQALLIDNKRILHGRAEIRENLIKRLLIRHWISIRPLRTSRYSTKDRERPERAQ